jgi:hypothetical protein
MKKLFFALAAAAALPLAWAAGDAASRAAPAAPTAPVVKGEVLEVKDADPYTYLRLKTAQGETWAAVNKAAVAKGTQVTIENSMTLRNFESKSLKRTFDTIVFGTLAGSAGAGAAAPAAKAAGPSAGTGMPAHAQAQGAAPPVAKVAKVAKAEGASGRTVAEVNAQRLALKDKPVAIRGTVVKVNAGIMGKTWVHLRDGTGSAADGSDDVLVTSKEVPKVGDVVLARGVVRTDVTVGPGYAYRVLVEEVSFAK